PGCPDGPFFPQGAIFPATCARGARKPARRRHRRRGRRARNLLRRAAGASAARRSPMSKLAPRPLLALLPLLCSCALAPPYKSDGPVQAEGVTVTLAAQKCDFETSTDPEIQSMGGELELNLRVQITNGTQQAVDFDPANLRLTVGDSHEPPARAKGAVALWA